jgi:PhnB protein
MSRVSTYLNFMGDTEEAFNFYRSVFGTEFLGPIWRMGEMPGDPSAPPLSDEEKNMVMHVELPILAGHVLMATDMLPSQGHELRVGNNMTINLELEDRDETDRLFAALSEGASDKFGLQDMPWGAYWGTCADKYGVRWMFNCSETASAE